MAVEASLRVDGERWRGPPVCYNFSSKDRLTSSGKPLTPVATQLMERT